MKGFYINTIGLACIFFAASCSKSSTGTSPVTTTTTVTTTPPQPKAGTIDKTDTIKIMAYNVLNYGDLCQGVTSVLNGYLKTIIQYAQPDVLSMEKMNYYQPVAGSTTNLAEDITNNALNAVFANRYTYAPPTNNAGASTMSTLFYNKQKLTYVNMHIIEAYVTDFDLYKLYYNDPNIAITHDTTFLYVLVNHTQSGSSSTTRDAQLSQEMINIRKRFAYLPNMVNMGDFNFRNSSETGYQSIITSTDTTTKFSDTPFFPDKVLQYPADWDSNPASFNGYLTTSTRLSASIPNTCGTSGGGKSWYDHIFISPWLVNATNYMQYIKGSYKTVGNDGQRVNVSINSVTPVVNASVPSAVADALFQFSNKYPVTLQLVVHANRTGSSVADPVEVN